MRLGLVIVLAMAGAMAGGCSEGHQIELDRWSLSAPGSRDRELRVPATAPDVPDGATYSLACELDLPRALQGRPLTFTISHLRAPAVLRVDGVEAPAIDGDGLAPYHAWRIPGSTGHVRLALEVRNSSFFGTIIGSAPQVGDGLPVRYRVARAAAGAASIIAVILAALMALIYAVTWLLDRARAAHGWFALQAILVVPAYAAMFGATPAEGAFVALMYLCMIAAAVAGLYFVYAEFDLGRAPRLVPVALTIAIADFAIEPDAFGGGRHLSTLLYVIGLPIIGYVVVRLIGVARRRDPERVSAALFACAWAIFLGSAVPDVLITAQRTDLVAGIYGSSIGIALYVLVHALVLARERALAARRQEQLNRELRRQVAERSRELSEALARLQFAPAALLEPGAIVDGRYRIGGVLGRGGMGQVYTCERIADGAAFALKVLRGGASPTALARFAREAAIAARLDNAHLIAVHDVGVTPEGVLFLIMDLATGPSLEARSAHYGDIAWGIAVLRDIARGLAALHTAGVVHRDLKPANVLLCEGGARIADFGVASLLATPGAGFDDTVDAGSPLTRTGAVVGTPLYMAPELMEDARDPKPSSDLYSFGVVGYEILARRSPFADAVDEESLTPLRVAVPGVADEVAALIDRALSRDPNARPTAADAVRVLGDS